MKFSQISPKDKPRSLRISKNPSRKNPKDRHTVIRQWKSKDKEDILKGIRKMTPYLQVIHMIMHFSPETKEERRKQKNIF